MRRLQEFGFDKSPYERPNQKWVCGRSRDGQCCLAGPDEKGNCTASAECRPLRKGDRWQCSRPAFLGGPCADGPSPTGQCCRVIPKCSPVRSVRSLRELTVMIVVGATLACLLLALGAKSGNRMFSPGQLSFSHRSAGENCGACHDDLQIRPARWLAKTPDSHSAHAGSQLCLKCHNVGDSPLQPHSLAPSDMRLLTQLSQKKNTGQSRPAGLALASFVPSINHTTADIACATCHKEHHGEEADLKKLTNQQCQSCHATQFSSFAEGHPQFTSYPFERRSRIIFDHQSHLREHFSDATVAKFAPDSCLGCHLTDLRGGTMLVKPYDVICASCHDNQIKAKSAAKTGIPFIGIPRMDDHTLAGTNSIGQWPEDADQPLTPFLRLILAGDPQLHDALDKLQGVDLASLPAKDPDKVKAAQTLAWGIKSLIFDLNTRGQEELLKRIAASAGRPLSNYEKEGVVAFFNAEAFRNTFQGAFPKLQKEILDYRKTGKAAATELVPSPDLPAPGPVKNVPPDEWVDNGGWYSPDGSFTLFYHPRGHRDRFLSSWMDLTVDSDHTASPAVSQALFKQLTAPTAVGMCAKCHSVDDTPVKRVNWIPSQPDPLEHKFNHFSHSTHLSLMDARGCFTCHSMTENAGVKETYAATFEPGKRDPTVFHSSFRTIDKNACATCHRPNLVRQDCLLCHNYHIGHFKPVVPHVNLVSAAASASTPQPH